MTARVTLISPARSEALEEVRFDDDRPLSTAGLRQLDGAAGAVPPAVPRAARAVRAFVSPSVRCRLTAEGLGLGAATAPAAAGCAMGRWRGRGLEEVSAAEPAEFAAWMSQPGSAPHGGESLHEFCARIARWLGELAEGEGAGERSGRTVAVVEPDVVRASVVCALDAPLHAFWRVDVPPLTRTELSGRAQRWNVSQGTPLAPAG